MKQSNIDQYAAQLEAIDQLETQTGYDATYMKEMLEYAPEALAVFNGFLPMARHRKVSPTESYWVAKLAAYRHCDCGPCFQLSLRLAEEEGLDRRILEHFAWGKGELSPKQACLSDFAVAILDGDASLEARRAELEAEYDKATLIEMALAIAAAQIFPVVKRAMGHYKSCQMMTLHL